MRYSNTFNVFMQQYGDSGGGGYSTGSAGGTGDAVVNLAGADTNPAFGFVGSEYNFTDPPRYYKANDPYYFEVDNIPLKQIHENCLWLKDQIEGVSLSVTGVSTSQILDLQPYTTNADREVKVRPGKFIGRVNDAYSISNLVTPVEANPTIDLTRSPIYQTPSIRISNDEFRAIVGSTMDTLLYSNGLSDHYQHHPSVANNVTPNSENVNSPGIQITYSNISDFLNEAGGTVNDIPKIKTAIWQQLSNSSNETPPNRVDLQQLSVDFCRRWQGIFRTSVVNIAEQLSVQIEPFDSSDYIDNNSTYDPKVRIDLVYAYTVPVDSSRTSIAKDAAGPETLTAPRLGVVKGAGGIITAKSYGGAETAVDIITNPAEIGAGDWINQETQAGRYYDTTQNLSPLQDAAIQAPLSDQHATTAQRMPFPGKGTGLSFPSPDDLMNLAPIVSQDAVDNAFATVGQSVLPICYVIVKEGAGVITSDDVIDIRPFLRTSELTYNERAGVAAANPPLSLANPSVGKYELYNALQLMRDIQQIKLDNLNTALRASIQEVPIAQAKFSALFTQIVDGGGAVLGLKEIRTLSNNPGSLPELYSDMTVGGQVITPTTGEDSTGVITCLPGIYLVEATVHASPQNYFNSNSRSTWKIKLINGEADLYPASDSNKQTFRCYADEGDAYKQESGSASFKAMVTVPESAPGRLKLQISRDSGSSSQKLNVRGSIHLTRLANLDGTEGPITAGGSN